MKKKLITLLLSCALVFTLLPTMAFAQEGTDDSLNGSSLKEIAQQLQDKYLDPFDYLVPKEATRVVYPSSYDLRNQGLVTSVKFQNPFGTCWGFSAVAAAETSILGSGLATNASTLNLSEKHLAYFVNQPITDTSDPQYGEGTHAASGITLQDKFNVGGTPFMATASFASGIGPILESRNSVLEYKGKNEIIDESGYYYSADDDWSVPEKWRFKSSYVLEESYMLPCPAQVSKFQDEYFYSYNADGTRAIKDMLMRKYAVQIGFHANSPMLGGSSDNVNYISSNWAHYTYNDNEDANHAVTIVGWDDNYSKSKFLSGHQPPGNGAWLVKNSWGSETESFPNKGPGWGITNSDGKHTGYFWLSYYDKSITMPEALKFESGKGADSYIVDQHDMMPVNQIMAATSGSLIKMSNVFTAKECQKLEEVSCETTYPGTKVKSQIYLLPKSPKSPTDGKLVATVEVTYEYGGFHKMKLSSPVLLQKDQRYSIVQTQYTVDGNYAINMPTAYGKDSGLSVWQKGVINSGESYVYIDGSWMDYSKNDLKQALYGIFYSMYAYDNFPIKGYSTPASSDIKMSISGKTTVGNSSTNKSTKLKVSYVGNDAASMTSPEVTWTLGSGGSDLFTLAPSSSDPTTATLTNKLKKVGSCLLYVKTKGVGTSVLRLTVSKRQPGVIKITSPLIYNGEYRKPKVVVYDEVYKKSMTSAQKKACLIPSTAYTVKYKYNKKCGTGRAYVTIKSSSKTYKGTINGTFTIKPKKSVISDMTEGKSKLTIKVKSQKASGAKYYQVYYRVKGTTKWLKKTFDVLDGNTLVIKKLKKGKCYQVKVRAYVKDINKDAGAFSDIKTSKKIK